MLKRKRVALFCSDPSLAIQSQKDEADINKIVRDFGVTGRVSAPVRLPEYGDFTGISDYRAALDAVRAAEAAFLEVPSKIRAEFNHDPGAWAAVCLNPENLPRLREWGLAKTTAQAEPPAPQA